MRTRSYFRQSIWPYLFVLPQVIAIVVFFFWPAYLAIKESLFRTDAFGLHTHFVWLDNFIDIFQSSTYMNSLWVTLVFSFFVTFVSMGSALLMAAMVDRVVKGQRIYNTLLIWPYAVAPAIAGILWAFLFNPAVGALAFPLQKLGYRWDYTIHGNQAMFLVILASAWQQFSYNFVFFLAGLKAVPKSFIEAAAIDGAGPFKRFWHILFPLLSPVTFFLLVTNLVYAFFKTFGVIQIVTQGGPANATDILVYRVYSDGFVGLDYGGSSAQSVILMVIVLVLTVVQFKYIEKRVHYK